MNNNLRITGTKNKVSIIDVDQNSETTFFDRIAQAYKYECPNFEFESFKTSVNDPSRLWYFSGKLEDICFAKNFSDKSINFRSGNFSFTPIREQVQNVHSVTINGKTYTLHILSHTQEKTSRHTLRTDNGYITEKTPMKYLEITTDISVYDGELVFKSTVKQTYLSGDFLFDQTAKIKVPHQNFSSTNDCLLIIKSFNTELKISENLKLCVLTKNGKSVSFCDDRVVFQNDVFKKEFLQSQVFDDNDYSKRMYLENSYVDIGTQTWNFQTATLSNQEPWNESYNYY